MLLASRPKYWASLFTKMSIAKKELSRVKVGIKSNESTKGSKEILNCTVQSVVGTYALEECRTYDYTMQKWPAMMHRMYNTLQGKPLQSLQQSHFLSPRYANSPGGRRAEFKKSLIANDYSSIRRFSSASSVRTFCFSKVQNALNIARRCERELFVRCRQIKFR